MSGLSQPQRQFLATLFVTILVLRTSARQLREPFAWPDFQQRVRLMALAPHAELVSTPDASFMPKSGQPPCGLGHFCTGCASRAERGREISTLAVVDVTRRCACTRAVSQTPPDEAATQAEPEDTRVDCYTPQLRAHRHRLPARLRSHGVEGSSA